MSIPDNIKLFGMSQQMVERDLDRVEEACKFDLGRDAGTPKELDETYYPQFEEAIRDEAAGMATHYQLFYCLEKSIRQLISGRLRGEHGANWWESSVPDQIQVNAKQNMKREIDSGVTPR